MKHYQGSPNVAHFTRTKKTNSVPANFASKYDSGSNVYSVF